MLEYNKKNTYIISLSYSPGNRVLIRYFGFFLLGEYELIQNHCEISTNKNYVFSSVTMEYNNKKTYIFSLTYCPGHPDIVTFF